MRILSVMVILVPTLVFNASAISHHHKHPTLHSLQKCTYPHVTLYVYTQPVQKVYELDADLVNYAKYIVMRKLLITYLSLHYLHDLLE